MQVNAKRLSIDQLWKNASDAARWLPPQSWREPVTSPRCVFSGTCARDSKRPNRIKHNPRTKKGIKIKVECLMVHTWRFKLPSVSLPRRRRTLTENDAIAYLNRHVPAISHRYERSPVLTSISPFVRVSESKRLLTIADVESKTQTSIGGN